MCNITKWCWITRWFSTIIYAKLLKLPFDMQENYAVLLIPLISLLVVLIVTPWSSIDELKLMKCFPEWRIILIVVLYLHGKATIEKTMINGLTFICFCAIRVLERFFTSPLDRITALVYWWIFPEEIKLHSVIQL